MGLQGLPRFVLSKSGLLPCFISNVLPAFLTAFCFGEVSQEVSLNVHREFMLVVINNNGKSFQPTVTIENLQIRSC